VSRADIFITKGGMLQGMGMSLMALGFEPKLCRIPISMIGIEVSEAMRGVRPRA
jgi:hypothetical protein